MFLVCKKKNIIALVVCLIFVSVTAVGVYFAATETASAAAPARKIPVYRVQTEEKVVALTFDAAWGADKTQGILDILAEYNADATFFLVGFWIEKFPETVKKIADAGLEIGNHSENHLNMSGLGSGEQNAEITSVNEAIYELTGKTPKYFRAPFGDYCNSLMTTVESLGMVGVQWSIDSLDWKGLSAAEIERRVVPNAKNGDIILMHNNSDHVLDALPLLLMGLSAKGFRFVSLDEMVHTEGYVVDNNGTQIRTGE